MDAFRLAQGLDPNADREKVSGFLLLIGSGPTVVAAGEDRDRAVEKAAQILQEKDTIIVVSKIQSRFGNIFVTKDQLILTRKQGGS
jgi:hypothetical protein